MPICAWSTQAQYQQRLKSFDFDITTERYQMRNTPGVELRSYFGSQAAKMSGSLNLAGISDPAVDVLIERVIAAKSRDELNTAAARPRPRSARGPLLGAALVQAVLQRRLLGQVFQACGETALRPRHSRYLVV
jgi:hypothetical protein